MFDKLKCAISIICLAVDLVLVLGSGPCPWGSGSCPCPGPSGSGPCPCPGPWGQVLVLVLVLVLWGQVLVNIPDFRTRPTTQLLEILGDECMGRSHIKNFGGTVSPVPPKSPKSLMDTGHQNAQFNLFFIS